MSMATISNYFTKRACIHENHEFGRYYENNTERLQILKMDKYYANK